MSTGNDVRVRYQRDGTVAVLSLARPEKRNALDDLTVSELRAALTRAAGDADVRVVLLRAEGADFCAGADLSQLERIASGLGPLENLEDAAALGQLFIEMRRHSKPIVAAVQGRALAGGAGLATACDLVIASSNATFGYPEVNIGFVPAMVMAILRRAVGEKIAFELIALGDPITADDARKLGLVNRVVDAADFDAASRAFAASLATRSASALSLSKRLLYGIDAVGFDEAIARGAEVNVLARATPDCQDGVKRFLARRRDA